MLISSVVNPPCPRTRGKRVTLIGAVKVIPILAEASCAWAFAWLSRLWISRSAAVPVT
jgi:hypothetical protein